MPADRSIASSLLARPAPSATDAMPHSSVCMWEM